MRIDAPIITGSFSLNGDTFNDLGAYTTTGSNTFIGDQSIVGAVSASALTGSISYTNLTDVPTLVSGTAQVVSILSSLNEFTASNSTTNTFTSSATARLNALETTSASVDTLNTAQNTRLTNLENKTGSLASTGSNTFYGTQTISGTLYIANDLIVQGSSSLQNITASAVSIGTNKVILNTDNPAVRYGGISVIDSGSSGLTGSILWDSTNNNWLYQNPSASSYVSAKFISGPQSQTLGSEPGLVTNFIQKAVGDDHISSSAIYDDGSTIKLLSNTEITGSLKVNAATSYFTGSLGIGTTSVTNRLDTAGGNVQFSSANVNVVAKDTGTGYAVFVAQAQNAGGGILDVGAHGSTAGGIVTGAPANAGIISSRNSHELHFGVAGTSRMMINTSGAVGIGTTNPSGKLHVVVPETQSGTAAFKVVGDTNGKAIVLGANTNYTWIQSHGSVPLYINELGNNLILNLSGGSVGIGTSSPSSKFHVYGGLTTLRAASSGQYDLIRLEDNAGSAYGGIGVNSSGWMYLSNTTGGTQHIVLTSGGKVGIGTTDLSGTAKFLVNGSIGFAGDTDKYLFMPDVGQGTGSIYMQAGFGSAQAGGAVRLYGHNATSFTGGDVEVGLSGKGNFLINSYIGGSRLVTVKVNGNVGLNDTNPSHKLDVNGTTRIQDTTMLGSSVGLLQMAMDGARWNHYGYSHLHIKTSILKGSDTMISFNIRGYYYAPNTIDTDVAFYNYNPVGYVYGVTRHDKAYGSFNVGLYYSSDNYVCIWIDGLGTYGGFALNWINTSLIQWGGRVYALASTRVNTSSAQY